MECWDEDLRDMGLERMGIEKMDKASPDNFFLYVLLSTRIERFGDTKWGK